MDYREVRECTYKGERYSVRDNGEVLRHARNNERLRKWDNIWTFGTKNKQTGYMTIGTARVHIIVATAFHGANDSKKLVVDHIDTNRCNNRPNNLRWITRLENVLLNPATLKKVEYLCGSIENFIKDPSCLRDVAGANQDVAWMRTVSAEEAKIAYENVMEWAKYRPTKKVREEKGLDSPKVYDSEWMFKSHKFRFGQPSPTVTIELAHDHNPHYNPYVNAIYPAVAVQLKWNTPTEFPCCPEDVGENSLREYASRLVKDEVFSRNGVWSSKVVESALYNDGHGLAVMTEPVGGGLKFGVAKIYIDDGKIVHETEGTYFTEEGARKYYTLLQGLEWTGGDCFDDFC